MPRLTAVVIGDEVAWKDGDPTAYISDHRKPGQRILVIPVGEAYTALCRLLGTAIRAGVTG